MAETILTIIIGVLAWSTVHFWTKARHHRRMEEHWRALCFDSDKPVKFRRPVPFPIERGSPSSWDGKDLHSPSRPS